jgi:hypothetical protein
MLSATFGFIGAIGDAVARGLAAAFVFALCIAITMYFIGRGLHSQAGWSRIAAGFFMVVFFLIGALMSLSAGPKGLGSLLGLALASGGAYGLWTLWKGFA